MKVKKSIKHSQRPQRSGFHWGIALILACICGAALYLQNPTANESEAITAQSIDTVTWNQIQSIQVTYPGAIAPPRLTWSALPINPISMQYVLLIHGNKTSATYFEKALAGALDSKKHHDDAPAKPAAVAAAPVITGINVSILMYHRTPADFDIQIKYLVDHRYTAIGFGELVSAIANKAKLPAKSVIITLDDGYADQLNEIAILRKYGMRATLFMITGGAGSNWCIGANAKGLPGCEAYLNWDQLRALDKEGLITIGGHTINHPNLAGLSADQQRAEIVGGKQEIETQLGHPIYDFAYPYGSFNATSIQIARQAGYREAVSTIPGTIHNMSTLFTLHRVRNSLELP